MALVKQLGLGLSEIGNVHIKARGRCTRSSSGRSTESKIMAKRSVKY